VPIHRYSMKIVQFLLDYIDPSLKERTGEAIHNRYYNPNSKKQQNTNSKHPKNSSFFQNNVIFNKIRGKTVKSVRKNFIILHKIIRYKTTGFITNFKKAYLIILKVLQI
jgi:hypothetical protein